jgi:hypothetical protein
MNIALRGFGALLIVCGLCLLLIVHIGNRGRCGATECAVPTPIPDSANGMTVIDAHASLHNLTSCDIDLDDCVLFTFSKAL